MWGEYENWGTVVGQNAFWKGPQAVHDKGQREVHVVHQDVQPAFLPPNLRDKRGAGPIMSDGSGDCASKGHSIICGNYVTQNRLLKEF